MIKIVADNKIPFLTELLGDVTVLELLNPQLIDAEAVKDADVLVTRTRTKCNAALLDGSKCQFIATATIGTDHIDFEYCKNNNIEVASAPGSNAPAVAQYVWASILRLLEGKNPAETTIGVVGVGHVGSIVARWGKALGYKILLNDPPRAQKETETNCFVDLDTIALESDVITFHTPYTRRGQYPTHHLCDAHFLNALQRNPIIINSARGPIVDTTALIDALDTGKVSQTVIDCWEGEPALNLQLLKKCAIATPHIAGYSLQGKTRASIAVANALSRHFNISCNVKAIETPPPAPLTVSATAILESYDPLVDTEILKAHPGQFEQLRNNYHLRNEVVANA